VVVVLDLLLSDLPLTAEIVGCMTIGLVDCRRPEMFESSSQPQAIFTCIQAPFQPYRLIYTKIMEVG
jgi:hypothetical protein